MTWVTFTSSDNNDNDHCGENRASCLGCDSDEDDLPLKYTTKQVFGPSSSDDENPSAQDARGSARWPRL
jgi:hypothetical protein